jgi:hypothetical protein
MAKVIIVGDGPGGLSAALTFSAIKRSFPREKGWQPRSRFCQLNWDVMCATSILSKKHQYFASSN